MKPFSLCSTSPSPIRISAPTICKYLKTDIKTVSETRPIAEFLVSVLNATNLPERGIVLKYLAVAYKNISKIVV